MAGSDDMSRDKTEECSSQEQHAGAQGHSHTIRIDESVNIGNYMQPDDIWGVINATRPPSQEELDAILETARGLKGLNDRQLAALLAIEDADMMERMFQAAREVKETVYGRRLVFFAPLYLSNYCTNNCLYCGFRHDNKDLTRTRLSPEQIREEVSVLLAEGHKRLLLVAGEDPRQSSIEYLEESISAVYGTHTEDGEIRRVNVNAAPMTVEEFRRLKECGIGTYQIFQETYHPETYAYMHPSGMKSKYMWRLTALDRAIEAGIDDVGIGPLFGLYDFRYECLALLSHIRYLEAKFGIGPHTISIPRLEPALNAPVAIDPPYRVSDMDFRKIVASLRLAVPYTGLILSTREQPELRDELFALGISQLSAGSCTSPGAYQKKAQHAPEAEQFEIGDTRSLAELIETLSEKGYIPSFCTACYRLERTGDRFMSLAKTGDIGHMCLPNAILSFQEYLLDHATPEAREAGERLIDEQLGELPETHRQRVRMMLDALREGKRDLYV